MRRSIGKTGALALLVLCLAGCGGKTAPKPQTAAADEVQEVQEIPERETDFLKPKAAPSEVDLDLTLMGSDMVFATIYQMMNDPASYAGKTVRLRGTYYAAPAENSDKYYHCVIIQDAAACCAQGMEFIWEDGSHKYPEEYPEEGAEIEVTGVFETYQEEGDSALYCRLAQAALKLEED